MGSFRAPLYLSSWVQLFLLFDLPAVFFGFTVLLHAFVVDKAASGFLVVKDANNKVGSAKAGFIDFLQIGVEVQEIGVLDELERLMLLADDVVEIAGLIERRILLPMQLEIGLERIQIGLHHSDGGIKIGLQGKDGQKPGIIVHLWHRISLSLSKQGRHGQQQD